MDVEKILVSYKKRNKEKMISEANKLLEQAEKEDTILPEERTEVENLIDMLNGKEEIQKIYIIHEQDDAPIIDENLDESLIYKYQNTDWIGIKVRIITKLITGSGKTLKNFNFYEGTDCWGFAADDEVSVKEGEDEEIDYAIHGWGKCSPSNPGIKGYKNIDLCNWREMFKNITEYLIDENDISETDSTLGNYMLKELETKYYIKS